MSCCGKSRTQARQSATTARTPTRLQPQTKLSTRITASPVGTVVFEYTGNSRLTVIGPVSRLRYEFQCHGCRLNVDHRDSNSLATVSTLKRL